MVESLNIVTAKKTLQNSFLLWVFAVTPFVAAEVLVDPTRPPAALGLAQQVNSQAVDSGPVLQSVLISSGRKVAVISGQAVNLGAKFGDSKVIKITESEVTLQNGKHLQTLKLFPGVEKRLTSGQSQTHQQADQRRQ